MVILVIEIWFLVREELVAKGKEYKGLFGFVFRAISLFVDTVTAETNRIDHRVISFFAALGIPVACILHGYVGFLFGSIKANPWWSTSLMFPIFILSAIVSGISV
jgi:Ni/Fe-hydrogenase subunit HybB-like protein